MITKETKIINGVGFERFEEREHWEIIDTKNNETPHVICHKCGSTAFSLYYGRYSLKARCITCQTEAEVYGG